MGHGSWAGVARYGVKVGSLDITHLGIYWYKYVSSPYAIAAAEHPLPAIGGVAAYPL